jgi:hypothetical protein
MENQNLPFITRKNLSFELTTGFAIRISTRSRRVVTLSIKGGTKEGIFSFEHTTTGTLTYTSSTFQIPDIPLWISVYDLAYGIQLKETYVTVDLIMNGTLVQRLASGHVYINTVLSWPNTNIIPSVPDEIGNVRAIASADPAAGVECSITVPTLVIWRVLAVRVQLVAAAAAASRRVHLVFTRATTGIIDCFSSVDQIISETKVYSAYPSQGNLSLTNDNDIIIPIPNNIILREADTITTETFNINAGDNFGVMTALVEEFSM